MDLESRSTSITVKTANLLWFRVVFILPVAFFGFIVMALIFSDANVRLLAFFLFLTLFASFGCYFLARYLTKSDTTIRVENDLLTLEQTNNILRKDTFRQFEIGSVRGYEISEVKSSFSLIIYLNDFSYYKYPLYRITEMLKFKVFFADKLTELTANHNPNFKNFWAAFLFALLRVSMCTLTVTILVYLTQILANYFQWSIANHKVLASLLYLTALTLCWIGLVRLPARKKKIRYMGFSPHNLLFLGISFILILLAFSTSNTLKEKPKKILSVSGILDNPKEKLFYIQHTNYNPKQTLLYRPIIKNRSKSNKLSVDHIFVTPISNSNQKEPIQPINFWITKTYTQSIPKAIPAVSKESMIKEFGLQSRVKLINQLQEKPEFYKILYNQLNLTKSHDQAYELIRSRQIFNSTAIILEPHWETLSVYKDELRLKIFWLLMGVLLFNGICAIAIAINR